MKLEIGKIYKDRGGRIAKIEWDNSALYWTHTGIYLKGDHDHPEGTYNGWTISGNYVEPGNESPFDLVEEL